MTEMGYIQVKRDNAEHCELFKHLFTLYAEEIDGFGNMEKPSKETILEWAQGMLNMQGPEDRHLELCYAGDKAVGFLYGKIDHVGHLGYIQPEQGYIMEFYVVPDERRKGYGKQMAQRIEALFAGHGAVRMYLTSSETGKAFWHAMGFEPTGRIMPHNGQVILEKAIYPIKELHDPDEKSKVCMEILESLPDWFGVPEAIIHYSNKCRELPVFFCFADGVPIGFAAIEQHGESSAEVTVIGIRARFHRRKIGKRLIMKCAAFCYENNLEFLTVKTLDGSSPDPYYAKTRLFYRSMGFHPLECIKEIWDERNPCLYMAKKIDRFEFEKMSELHLPFLTRLMSEPGIMESIHIGATTYEYWQRAFENWRKDSDDRNFIIRINGLAAGWIGLNGIDSGKDGWIRMLVVSNDFQRRGIGTRAVLFAEHYFKALGFENLLIHTTAENTAAHKCYLDCGFRITDYGECTTADGVSRMGFTYVKGLSEDIC